MPWTWWPGCAVRDWEQLVSDKMGARFASAHPAVVCELAAHLRETCEDLIHAGVPLESAERQALAQVASWNRLRDELERARGGGSMKNQQIRSVWLPGLLTAVSGFGMLRAMLVLSAVSWTFERRVTEILPWQMLESPGALFGVTWLAVLPLAGALGAYVSWRAGGRPGQRIFAALIPALVLSGTALLALAVAVAVGDYKEWHGHLLFHLIVTWFFLPGLALTLGTLPFLRLSTLSAQRG
jgi:hypothetical protein